MSKTCEICNKTLTGRQQKFCSRKCHNTFSNVKHQNYVAQQKRGMKRRLSFIKSKGGKCSICGYNKNSSALTFHHLNPDLKKFRIDMRRCSNNSIKTLQEEVDKCSLLCHNCHMELHHPNYDMILQ